MTEEQETMLKNGPKEEVVKMSKTKKAILIGTGLVAGAAAVYFLGPKLLGKVKPL